MAQHAELNFVSDQVGTNLRHRAKVKTEMKRRHVSKMKSNLLQSSLRVRKILVTKVEVILDHRTLCLQGAEA